MKRNCARLNGSRVELKGPDVRVPPKHALTLTLTLHELATNAAKYGALTAAAGILRLSWMVSEDGIEKRLTITWRETGVAIGNPANVKESFGTRLIKNAVVHDLRGRVDIGFERRTRVHCFGALVVTAAAPAARSGLSILLLEDEFLIALDAQDILMELGASQVEVVNTLDAAREAHWSGHCSISRCSTSTSTAK